MEMSRARTRKFGEENRAYRRSSAINKSRYARANQPLMKAVYGKDQRSVRLSYLVPISTNAVGVWNQVYDLTGALQGSNDWANFKQSYALYNVLKVKVKLIPGNSYQSTTNAILPLAYGMAYDPVSNGAITNLNQISDYEVYTFDKIDVASGDKYFKFKTKPVSLPPWSTLSGTNTMGYLKGYSSNITNSATASWGYMILNFYCVFGAIE